MKSITDVSGGTLSKDRVSVGATMALGGLVDNLLRLHTLELMLPYAH